MQTSLNSFTSQSVAECWPYHTSITQLDTQKKSPYLSNVSKNFFLDCSAKYFFCYFLPKKLRWQPMLEEHGYLLTDKLLSIDRTEIGSWCSYLNTYRNSYKPARYTCRRVFQTSAYAFVDESKHANSPSQYKVLLSQRHTNWKSSKKVMHWHNTLELYQFEPFFEQGLKLIKPEGGPM